MSSLVVLFDLDDTLYAEADFVISGRKAVAAVAEKCYGCDAGKALAAMRHAPQAFDALHGVLPQMSVGEMLDIYRNHMPELELPEDSRRALSALRSAGVRMGVITDGRSVSQRNKLAALGIAGEMDYIGISGETGADKTSRETFARAEEFFGSDCRFFYVGDNPAKDFLWPNRMGWTTVMLREQVRGRNIHAQTLDAQTPDANPDIIVDSLCEIMSLVNSAHK